MTPSLLTIARRTIANEVRIPRGSVVLAAVSGGPDSMSMLHVLARLGPELGFVVHAHGVDHGLRAEASRELDLAAKYAHELGVRFERTTAHVAPGGNVQARARKARYAALADAARVGHALWIATAHHADDRAETVLLRLLRGAGPRGLAVLPPRSPLGSDVGGRRASQTAPAAELTLVRPLVRARRSSIRAHMARHRIPYATDPSNDDARYLRTRVRRELLPLMARMSPQIVEHLDALADQLTEADAQPPEFPLPRATQTALAALARSRSKTARVWLPGGLVVTLDPRARPGPSSAPDR